MTASFLERGYAQMGTTEKTPKDWKFYTQLGVLVSGIAGGLTANTNLSERVVKLETQNQNQSEALKDFKETVKDLRDEIRRLREDMAARKIVNAVASLDNSVAGELNHSK
jgi:uncharacterized coiled-coil protein SlyX